MCVAIKAAPAGSTMSPGVRIEPLSFVVAEFRCEVLPHRVLPERASASSQLVDVVSGLGLVGTRLNLLFGYLAPVHHDLVVHRRHARSGKVADRDG